jgi:hypothetical protein
MGVRPQAQDEYKGRVEVVVGSKLGTKSQKLRFQDDVCQGFKSPGMQLEKLSFWDFVPGPKTDF